MLSRIQPQFRPCMYYREHVCDGLATNQDTVLTHIISQRSNQGRLAVIESSLISVSIFCDRVLLKTNCKKYFATCSRHQPFTYWSGRHGHWRRLGAMLLKQSSTYRSYQAHEGGGLRGIFPEQVVHPTNICRGRFLLAIFALLAWIERSTVRHETETSNRAHGMTQGSILIVLTGACV